MRWAYAQHQVSLPRAADAQSRVGVAVKAAELQVGDAIFFSDPDGAIVHEGVYVGGGQFVHAPGRGRRGDHRLALRPRVCPGLRRSPALLS